MSGDLFIEATKHAYISPSGYYRYVLARTWDPTVRQLAFVMLNPSTADAYVDDPTIRRCVGFARREGMGGIVVVNLFGGRATRPQDLFKMADPAGPRNVEFWDNWIGKVRPKTVCAWGAEPKAADQAKRFRAWACKANIDLFCLGKTKDGHPRHPLYLKNDTPLEPFA